MALTELTIVQTMQEHSELLRLRLLDPTAAISPAERAGLARQTINGSLRLMESAFQQMEGSRHGS